MQLGRQFDRGDDQDKADLLKQMRKSFPDRSLDWLRGDDVSVTRTHIHPSDIDWKNRHEWEATHEPKKVKEKRKDIKNGDDKPIVTVDRPGHDDLFIMDGHHHAEAYTQLGTKKIPAYVVTVPRTTGPWDEQHSKQKHNKDS